jgi:predicted RNA-binding protein with TRAM domain
VAGERVDHESSSGSGGQVVGEDGDAGVVEVQDVGSRGEGGARPAVERFDDTGPGELTQTAVDGVLREELEPFGDIPGAGLGEEAAVTVLGRASMS